MIEGINSLLKSNDIMCKIDSHWYRLESVDAVGGKMPIVVTDDVGGEWEYDMADIEEFDHTDIDIDPMFQHFNNQIGLA